MAHKRSSTNHHGLIQLWLNKSEVEDRSSRVVGSSHVLSLYGQDCGRLATHRELAANAIQTSSPLRRLFTVESEREVSETEERAEWTPWKRHCLSELRIHEFIPNRVWTHNGRGFICAWIRAIASIILECKWSDFLIKKQKSAVKCCSGRALE